MYRWCGFADLFAMMVSHGFVDFVIQGILGCHWIFCDGFID